MRTARLLTGTALAIAVAGLAAVPAYGADVGAGGLEVYPSTVAPGAEVTVNTAACGADVGMTGDAGAVGAGAFMLEPSVHEQNAVGLFRVPPSARPGTYEIVARCSGGRRLTDDLTVTSASVQEHNGGSAQERTTHPRGSVKTGVGGALGTDPVQTTAGVAALAVAAAGGTWLLHRRARVDGI